ncbi:TrmB family transcriptional regulator [Halohasta litorea]|uniref:TrmB family transcriptional regulator n=1 Tax=Halohasta litorea TaxID=869891 RepID=A0ABD6D373_9EURY|nr:TrmB family transcriptional regulator [Halohasta litorea]
METETFVDVLEEAGLSPYEAQVYVTLLDLGTASATEIADESGIPGPRIYDVLRSLADRGYAETYEQGTLQARAHDPTDVLEDLRERASQFEAAAAEVETRWEQPELKSNKASIVKRFQTVVDRAEQFIRGSENQVHLSATPADIDQLEDALQEAHDRGVAIHISVHTEADEAPPSAERFEGICKEVRHRRLPAPFVALIDRQKTCFSHHPETIDQYGVLVNDQTHSYVFHWYFMTCLWEHCETIYSERNTSPPIEYVDIRRLVGDIGPLVEAGDSLAVSVEGHNVQTGQPVSVTGTVTGTEHATGISGAEMPYRVAGQATLYVDTGEEELSVGGWGAVIEDIEATRIVLEAADRPVEFDR